MAIHQNQALQQYRRQFDLAQTYTYLTAAAYDYETNLTSDDPQAGDRFLRQIVGVRSLGEIAHGFYANGDLAAPVPGEGGLAEPLGQMKGNFDVLKGQMGFNNPQKEANQFSLRNGLFRLGSSADATTDGIWRQTLQRYYTPNIYSVDAVAQLAKRPYDTTDAQPGLVIPFPSTMM